MTQRTILDVDWIVLEETTPPPPAADPVIVSAQPAAPEPQHPVVIASRSGEAITPPPAPAIRPWAKPLLIGALALAALWLAAMLFIILDGALFADAAVRLSLGLAGIPICVLIAVAFVADPDHESNAEETYWTLSGYPVGPCTPTRANTLTGGRDQ